MKRIVGVFFVICVLFSVTGCNEDIKNDSEVIDQVYVTPKPEDATIDIETDFAILKYPEKWKDNLKTLENDNKVEFYGAFEGHDEVLLYTLVFGAEEGYHLGTFGKTELYVIDSEVKFDDSWSNEDVQTVYDMQEAINVSLQGLVESDNFVFATDN